MIRVLTIVAVILAAMTWIAGWWGVPLVAAVVGVILALLDYGVKVSKRGSLVVEPDDGDQDQA